MDFLQLIHLHFYDRHWTQSEERISSHIATITNCKHLISAIEWLDLKSMVTEWKQNSSHLQPISLIPFLSYPNHWD
jgi:hypothetical protein